MGWIIETPPSKPIECQEILKVTDLSIVPIICLSLNQLILRELIVKPFSIESDIVNFKEQFLIHFRLLLLAKQRQKVIEIPVSEVEDQGSIILKFYKQALVISEVSSPNNISNENKIPYFDQRFELSQPEVSKVYVGILLIYACEQKLQLFWEDLQGSFPLLIVYYPLHIELILLTHVRSVEYLEQEVLRFVLVLPFCLFLVEVVMVVFGHVLYFSLDCSLSHMPRVLELHLENRTAPVQCCAVRELVFKILGLLVLPLPTPVSGFSLVNPVRPWVMVLSEPLPNLPPAVHTASIENVGFFHELHLTLLELVLLSLH